MNTSIFAAGPPDEELPLPGCSRLETEGSGAGGLPGVRTADEFGSDEPGESDETTDSTPRRAPSGQTTDSQLAEWMHAIVDHDERALAALYDATFSRVFGIVRRIVRRLDLAEEVVEDTYFQVWRQAVRFDPARGSAITWLLAIARLRAIDAIRHEARFQHESLEDVPESAQGLAAAPRDDLLELARHQAELHQALMQLGPQPRQLVSLAFFRGLSHEEIASQTCLPLGTVKSQIRRALLTLRQLLGKPGLAAIAS